MKKNVFVIMVLCACLAGLSSCAFLKKTMNPCGDNPCYSGEDWRIMVESCKGDRTTNQVTVNVTFTRTANSGQIFPTYKFVDDTGKGVSGEEKAQLRKMDGTICKGTGTITAGKSISLYFTAAVSPDAKQIASLYFCECGGYCGAGKPNYKMGPINNIPIVWE
ncbi:hypothetical protein LJC30_04605 [Odoribacter sp. OttesenSCG-928-L07]|nr:hypothetical protein [Odoribacter sp. OttesenSCG-928-L07]MDL2239085.1 hypothetical protein [Bacteroidales bacterium OttesenSCG-928-L14]MDL2239998.1 hypothetical protein [Bacteroidales bacterium OttesenSCG-928-K22]